MASITIRKLAKHFGATQVLRGIDIDIRDGEFVALVGPSGCGKSTLLRLIAGLEAADGGDILLGDRRINDTAPRERDVAMVFQNYALYPHMTVAQNLGFGLKIQGIAKDQIARRVQQAADTLGLGELLQRHPRQLSGGQRQRVAMGRAIVRQPQAFLFDEPLSNLDAKLRVQMRTEIKALHQRLGTTTVYVTHDQVEAMTMADRIVVLREGIIEQAGAPVELYARPRNQFVAGFLGAPQMNFFAAKVTAAGERLTVALNAGGQVLDLARREGTVGTGDAVTIGVRPEHLVPAPNGALMVEVVSTEVLGAETVLHGRTAGGEPVTATMRGILGTQRGEQLRFDITDAFTHVFDAKGLTLQPTRAWTDDYMRKIA